MLLVTYERVALPNFFYLSTNKRPCSKEIGEKRELGTNQSLSVSDFPHSNSITLSESPCVKFRKYFDFAEMSENTFQSFDMVYVYEKKFFS